MSTPSSRRPSLLDGWEVLYEDPTLRIWALREVMGVAWFEVPTGAQMAKLAQLGKLRARSHPAGVALFQLVVSGTPRFTEEVREEVANINRDNVFARGGVHIILVDGLAGAAARAFLSTVLLVRRGRAPAKVFGDVPEASAWLAKELGGPWQATDLVRMGTAMIGGRGAGASLPPAR